MVSLIVLLAMLLSYNVVINKWLPSKWHLLFSFSLSCLTIIWVVRDETISLADIGINLSNVFNGLLYGGLAFLLITLSITLVSLVPQARRLFDDERSKSLTTKQFVYKALVHIPLSTVLLEEVIFRGVMLALLLNSFSTLVAVSISSLLFGLWHVLPAITSITSNGAASKLKHPGFPVVVGTVIVTTLAGVAFSWLRLASGSLIAPMFAHYIINTGGTTSSWVLHRLHRSKQKVV